MGHELKNPYMSGVDSENIPARLESDVKVSMEKDLLEIT